MQFSLERSLIQCFQISISSLLMVWALCSGLFKIENSYYFYDSHSHDPTAIAGTDDGKAILKKYSSVEFFVSYLYAFYENVNLLENTTFEIQPIQISVVL